MARLVTYLETATMNGDEQTEEFQEALASLARAQAYAEELVEDDYLWTDATADYCRVKIEKLLNLLGDGS